jgi:PhnB protein
MAQNPPQGRQRIIPYVLYEDAPAAIEFLGKAFGFEERMRMPGPDGRITHAEVGYQGNVVMLATAVEEMGHASPRDLPARHSLIVCYVDDVDAHHARAKAAGAQALSEPEDQPYGERTYRARDPEGHEWYFHTHLRKVAAEGMKPPQA